MIIGESFKNILNNTSIDLTVGNRNVSTSIKCHYGDHKELIKWLYVNKKARYPLVWYVVKDYYDESESYKYVDNACLIILTDTKPEWLNNKKSLLTYNDIIEPVWLKIRGIIENNQYISIVGNKPKKYKIIDEPNYGINSSDINDFSNKQSKGEKSQSLDIVDGRIINFNLRINTNCK